MRIVFTLIFILAFFTNFAQKNPLKQEENKFGEVFNLDVGKAVLIDSVRVHLTTIRPSPSDYTKEHKKSMVVLNVGEGAHKEEIIIGDYSEEARISHQRLFSVVSCEKNNATIRVNKFSITFNAEEISPALKNINLPFGTPLMVGDLSIELKDFFHVNEHGSYFSIKLSVTDGTTVKEYNDGRPFNFLGHYFTMEVTDFSQAKLTVKPLSLGNEFYLGLGEKIQFLKEGITIEMLEKNDNQSDQIEYEIKLEKAGRNNTGKIVQSYTIQRPENSPGEKIPMRRKFFNTEKSVLTIKWEDYILENVLKYDEINQHTTNSYILIKH